MALINTIHFFLILLKNKKKKKKKKNHINNLYIDLKIWLCPDQNLA